MQRESVSSYAIIQSVLYEDVAVDCFIVILQPIHSYDIYDCTEFVLEPWWLSQPWNIRWIRPTYVTH